MPDVAEYTVRAVNSARSAENRIHGDEAVKYGFQSGLVPGVNLYGYLTVPVVSCLGRAFLERGRIGVKFLQPVYEGETLIVRTRSQGDVLCVRLEGASVRAAAEASLCGVSALAVAQPVARSLPALEERPEPADETIFAGRPLGELREDLSAWHRQALEALGDPLEIYRGDSAIAHPSAFLALANQVIVRNYRISPWIHTASDVFCRAAAAPAQTVNVRAAISSCYERKGHRFMVLDVAVTGQDGRLLQQIAHTAIWKLRASS